MLLRLPPDLKTVILQSFRVLDFVRIDFSYQFSRLVKDEELADFDLMDYLRPRVTAATAGQAVEVSNPELVFLYTSVDLLCKSFFADAAAHFSAQAQRDTGLNEEEYKAKRSQTLQSAELFLANCAKALSTNPRFQKTQERLAGLTEELMG